MKKCPLFIINDTRAQLGEETEIGDCLGTACAAYDETGDNCSVLGIPRVLVAIGGVLGQIHDELCLSKYTYTCHYCQVRIQKTAAGEFKEPAGWTREEQVDGHYVWICDRCDKIEQNGRE